MGGDVLQEGAAAELHLALLKHLTHQQEQLVQLVGLALVDHAAGVGQLLEGGQHLAGVVDHVEIEHIGAVALNQGMGNGLHQHTLAAGDGAADRQMAVPEEIDGQGELGLVLGIVHHAHGGPQGGLDGGILPLVIRQNRLLLAADVGQEELLGQDGHPQPQVAAVLILLGHLAQVFHDGIELGLVLALGQLPAGELRLADDPLRGSAGLQIEPAAVMLHKVIHLAAVEGGIRVIDIRRMESAEDIVQGHDISVGLGHGCGAAFHQLADPAALLLRQLLAPGAVADHDGLAAVFQLHGEIALDRAHVLVIHGAAPAGLEELIDLIIAHLQIAASGLGQIGRIGLVEHILTVLLVGHPQTQAELGIGPDIVVDGAGGLLGRQDQMDTQASTHLGHGDQLPHKLRLLPLQLRKLIDDDEHMGDGQAGLAGFHQLGVAVDVVDTVLVEDPLTAHILTLDGNHGPVDLVAGEVGDGAQHMGQIVKEVCHAAALEVDDEEAHIQGTVIDGQGEDVGLQGLGLTGAGGTGDEAVGAVVLFMDVQIAGCAAHLPAHHGLHGLVGTVLLPVVQDIQILELVDTQHLEEGQRIGQIAAAAVFCHPDVGDPAGKLLGGTGADIVEFDLLGGFSVGGHGVHAGEGMAALDDIAAAVGQILEGIGQQQGGDTDGLGPLVQILGQGLGFHQVAGLHQHHILGGQHRLTGGGGAVRLVGAGAEDLGQLIAHTADLGALQRHIALGAVAVPHMGQPLHEGPVGAGAAVAEHRHTHIGIAVVGGQLGDDGPGNIRPVASHQTHHTVVKKIHIDGHLHERCIGLLDLRGTLGEVVLVQRKFLFGDGDGDLEGDVAQTQTAAQEILVAPVAAPQLLGILPVVAASAGIGVHFQQGAAVELILAADPLGAFHQIFAVFLQTQQLGLLLLLLAVTQIDQRPGDADDGGGDGGDEADVHKGISAGAGHIAGHGHEAGAQQHGQRHGEAGADDHPGGLTAAHLLLGRALDLLRLRVQGDDLSGGTVEQRFPALHLHGLPDGVSRSGDNGRQTALLHPLADHGAAGAGVDGDGIDEIDHLQSKDIDDITEPQLRPALDPLAVEVDTVDGAILQHGGAVVEIDGHMMSGPAPPGAWCQTSPWSRCGCSGG